MTIEHALALAARGFRVFPLAPGSKKPPRDFSWKSEATTDPARISHWWSQEPRYNVGVATGEGVLVIDADSKGGREGLSSLALLDTLGLDEGSYRVETPSGGVHVYLKTDQQHGQRVDTVAGFPGIDIRCDGGYVVGPGSETDDGTYRVINDVELAAAPWFDEILVKGHGNRAAKTEAPLVDLDQQKNIDLAKDYLINRAPEAIEGAGGDDTTFRVATRCRDYGLSEGVVLDLMLDFWNEQKASPPWAPDELASKVANAFQYATGSWGGQTAEAEFGALDIDVGESPVRKSEVGIPTSEIEKGKTKILRILSYEDMVQMPEPEWLIDGLVPAHSAVLAYGPSNTFKSFLAADMGLSLATGRDWHGFEVRQTNVLFVATEGAAGFGRLRIPGWYAHYDVPTSERGNAWLFPQELSIDDKECVELLVSTLKHKRIGLVVLDIFGGTMDGPETEDTTARAWVRGVQKIIRDTGASVLTVAHTGWQDKTRARMHTHFWGSFDSRLWIDLPEKTDKTALKTTLKIERHKDADSSGFWRFKLQKSHGSLVPTLDLDVDDQADWPENLKKALTALENALNDKGDVRFEDGWPMCRVVRYDVWRDHCGKLDLTQGKTRSALSNAVKRAAEGLERLGAIGQKDGFVWNAKEAG